MEKIRIHHHLIFNLFSLQVLFLQLCSDLAVAGSAVKFLPGFDGPLPFELETGYVGVGESEDVQLFYYFVKSESNPKKDPLLFWFSGGPGCSSFTALVFEIGPINLVPVKYDGSLPKFVLNPHSWTKIASIVFVDTPVGTGYSYATTTKASHSNDIQASDQNYEFLRKWLIDHWKFIGNPLYVGGDSYSGMIVPIVTQLISNGNEVGIEPRINLKGYLLGNPVTSVPGDANYDIQFAHGMGLISDELYESLKETCKGKYFDIDSGNALCIQTMKTFNQLLDHIDWAQILEPNCSRYAKIPTELLITGSSRAMYETLHLKLKDERIRSPFKCRTDGDLVSYYWANDNNVQDALHVRKGTIGDWRRCQDEHLNYTKIVTNVVPYHANLSMIKSYRSLIYSGDHDMIVPHFATQAWIRSLNYSIVDDWRQWSFEGQVAGYTRTYANRMTFATVKGGGHTAPEYKPPECKAMFQRWLASEPL